MYDEMNQDRMSYEDTGYQNSQQGYAPNGNENPQPDNQPNPYVNPQQGYEGFYNPQPPVKKKKTGLVIGIIVGVIAAVVVAALVIVLLGKQMEQKEYSKGTLSGDVYKSEFLGLQIQCPDGYTISDSSWSETIVENIKNYNATEDSDYSLDNALTELMVSNDVGSENMLIVITNNGGMSEKTIASVFQKELANNYSTAGYTYDIGDITTEQLAGTSYRYAKNNLSAFGSSVTQEIYMRNIGDYFVSIVFTFDDSLESDADIFKNSISEY